MKKSVVEPKFKELECEACSVSSLSSGQMMKNNIDVLACKAECYLRSGEYQKCSELTSVLVGCDFSWVEVAAICVGFHTTSVGNLAKSDGEEASSRSLTEVTFLCSSALTAVHKAMGKMNISCPNMCPRLQETVGGDLDQGQHSVTLLFGTQRRIIHNFITRCWKHCETCLAYNKRGRHIFYNSWY